MLKGLGEVLIQLATIGATASITTAARHLWRLISDRRVRSSRPDHAPEVRCPCGGEGNGRRRSIPARSALVGEDPAG
jgi:hypothetical protein